MEVECVRYGIWRHTYIHTYLYRYAYMHPGMIKGAMNNTTNLFVLLIVILFIFPATAIRYVQAATENSQESSNTGNGQENSSSSTGNEQQQSSSTTENSQQSNNTGNEQQQSNNTGNAQEMPGATSPSGSTANATSPSGSTANATSPSGSTASNNTGITQQKSNNTGITQQKSNNTLPYSNINTTNNNDIYYHHPPMDLKDMVLAVHNRERAAVGVPPLSWNDELAAHAKVWAEYVAKVGKLVHCFMVQGCTNQTGPPWPNSEGENIASEGHMYTLQGQPIAHGMQGWIAEKPIKHWLQMVSRTAKYVGCGTASGGPNDWRGWDILDCRYSPPGIDVTVGGQHYTQ
jgi:uncharacterized protein YkwD